MNLLSPDKNIFHSNIIYIELLYIFVPINNIEQYGINFSNKRYIQSFIPVRENLLEVHDITINEAMLLCCLKDGENEIRRYDLRIYRVCPTHAFRK